MKEYEYKVEDNSINLDQLLGQTVNIASFAEKRTYIWVMHPKLSLAGLKDQNGRQISQFNTEMNIDFLLSRPTFYSEVCPEDTIYFREYKP
ncbi:unnamed protein product [marine sediment metagenome]|uniref:Uncharacterized protein n=1 Tax=marine sediment metagenome TaxID=412755 RepID=X0XSX1_9ZZZZ